MNISATILAAGASQRMGDINKLLLPYKGETIIKTVCQTLIDSFLDPVFVVIGFEYKKVAKSLPKSLDTVSYTHLTLPTNREV